MYVCSNHYHEYIYLSIYIYICVLTAIAMCSNHDVRTQLLILVATIHYPKYDDNVSFQGLLKFAPT